MGDKKTTADILSNLRTTLNMTRHGLHDLMSDNPMLKDVGLRNLAVHGRSVTFVLQNLKSTEPSFEEWYKPHQDEMKSSPLCKFFLDMRNEILKEGMARPTTVSLHIKRLNMADLHRLPKPENAVGFFMGDQLGGTGWEVQLPDGSKEKFYVSLPEDIGIVRKHFVEPPKMHLGESLENKTIEEIGEIYFGYLNNLVDDALKKFKA